MSDVLVKVLISPTGADTDSFEVIHTPFTHSTGGFSYGSTIHTVDNDNLIVQTGATGYIYVKDADGTAFGLTNEAWYYKVKVYRLT